MEKTYIEFHLPYILKEPYENPVDNKNYILKDFASSIESGTASVLDIYKLYNYPVPENYIGEENPKAGSYIIVEAEFLTAVNSPDNKIGKPVKVILQKLHSFNYVVQMHWRDFESSAYYFVLKEK